MKSLDELLKTSSIIFNYKDFFPESIVSSEISAKLSNQFDFLGIDTSIRRNLFKSIVTILKKLSSLGDNARNCIIFNKNNNKLEVNIERISNKTSEKSIGVKVNLSLSPYDFSVVDAYEIT